MGRGANKDSRGGRGSNAVSITGAEGCLWEGFGAARWEFVVGLRLGVGNVPLI